MLKLARSVHPLPGESERRERFLSLVDALAGRRVTVVGDIIADEFIYGQVARVSREAPVLILRYDSTEVVPGGAGNAANNVAALGGRARLVGLIGRDEPGRRFVESMQPGIERRWLITPPGYRTPIKTRILAGGIHSAKQQIVRIDREATAPAERALKRQVLEKAVSAAREADAVLVSDYGSGLVSPALVAAMRRAVRERGRRRPVPILVDSRYGLFRYRGLTACTPNESEVEQLLGVKINDHLPVLERAGRQILERTRMAAVLVTRGSRGMALFQPGEDTIHIPIFGSDEIADVTGAGDTVIATVTLALAAGASFYEAARLANYAGGSVVMKRGTATVSAPELADAVTRDHPTPRESWSQEGPDQGGRLR